MSRTSDSYNEAMEMAEEYYNQTVQQYQTRLNDINQDISRMSGLSQRVQGVEGAPTPPTGGAAKLTGTCDFCGKKTGELIQDVYVCDKKTCQKKAEKVGLRQDPSFANVTNGLVAGASLSRYMYSDDGIAPSPVEYSNVQDSDIF